MANWIIHPTKLTGKLVELVPLEKKHFPELFAAAADERLWELIPVNCSRHDRFIEYYTRALTDRRKGIQYPFVIIHRETKKIIGSTRLFEIYPADLKLEIGWTWVVPVYWGTAINPECKLLLLQFCFDELKARRVQLKTDERNIRSRKAIEKIGAKFEGVLRKDRIKENGESRNAAYYSILDIEWPEARKTIQEQIRIKTGPGKVGF